MIARAPGRRLVHSPPEKPRPPRPIRAGLVAIALAAMATSSLVVVAGPASAQATPAGSIGVRLLDAPAAAQDDPRAHLYIVDHLAPGTTIERRIEVSNTSTASQHVVVYAAAATIADGTFVGSEGHATNELSTWSTVTPGDAQIASGGATTAVVTISVPRDAPPGEQYAVVWAEARSAAPDGGGVVQVNRVGIRLYVSVGPGGPPAADFTIDTLTARRTPDGTPMVSARVRNTGGRALDINGTLDLSDGPGGLRAGPFAAQSGSTLGIGDSQPVTLRLDERLPAGPWHASVTLRSGLTERAAAAAITFPRSGRAAPVAATTSDSSPWVLIGTVVLLVVLTLAGGTWALRRRRAA